MARSQAQRDAQINAMQAARGAAAKRAEAKQLEERAREDRERQAREHVELGLHLWSNYEYADDYKTMTRVCRECGATETKPIRL